MSSDAVEACAYLDGKLVAKRKVGDKDFPKTLNNVITLGSNAPRNRNSFADVVLDALRISSVKRERFTPDAAPAADKDTLFLVNFNGTTKPEVGKGGNR